MSSRQKSSLPRRAWARCRPPWLARRGPQGRRAHRDAGMTTAEYAIGTLAACGFAALLVTILRSGEVQGLLTGIIRRALSMG
jgi:Protein of unknown function (DUF4244)